MQLSSTGHHGKWSRYSATGFQGRWDITPDSKHPGRGSAAFFKSPMDILSPMIEDTEFPEIRDELKRRLKVRDPIYPVERIFHGDADPALKFLAMIPNTLRPSLLSSKNPQKWKNSAPGWSSGHPWKKEVRHLEWVNKLKQVAYDKVAMREREDRIRAQVLANPYGIDITSKSPSSASFFDKMAQSPQDITTDDSDIDISQHRSANRFRGGFGDVQSILNNIEDDKGQLPIAPMTLRNIVTSSSSLPSELQPQIEIKGGTIRSIKLPPVQIPDEVLASFISASTTSHHHSPFITTPTGEIIYNGVPDRFYPFETLDPDVSSALKQHPQYQQFQSESLQSQFNELSDADKREIQQRLQRIQISTATALLQGAGIAVTPDMFTIDSTQPMYFSIPSKIESGMKLPLMPAKDASIYSTVQVDSDTDMFQPQPQPQPQSQSQLQQGAVQSQPTSSHDYSLLTVDDLFALYAEIDDENQKRQGKWVPKSTEWKLPPSPAWQSPPIGHPPPRQIRNVPYAETTWETGRLEGPEPVHLPTLFPFTTELQRMTDAYSRPVAPDPQDVVGESLYYTQDEVANMTLQNNYDYSATHEDFSHLTQDGRPKRKAVLQPKKFTQKGFRFIYSFTTKMIHYLLSCHSNIIKLVIDHMDLWHSIRKKYQYIGLECHKNE